MSSMAELTKTCMLICLLQFLFPLHARGGDNSSYGTEKTRAYAEQTVDCDTAPWLKPGLLNSTRIELKFGSYGVQILTQNQGTRSRLSNLYSKHEDEKIARTIAFTQYEKIIHGKLSKVHEEILAGGSIGSTFKKHGIAIKKDLFFKGLVTDMPNQLQQLMHTQECAFAAVIYNLVARDGDDYYPYCTILEVYSREFLTLEEVERIYPEPITEKVNPQNVFSASGILDHMKHLLDKI